VLCGLYFSFLLFFLCPVFPPLESTLAGAGPRRLPWPVRLRDRFPRNLSFFLFFPPVFPSPVRSDLTETPLPPRFPSHSLPSFRPRVEYPRFCLFCSSGGPLASRLLPFDGPHLLVCGAASSVRSPPFFPVLLVGALPQIDAPTRSSFFLPVA